MAVADVFGLGAAVPRCYPRPVVCFDESPVQLIGEAGQYRRNRTVDLFVLLMCIIPGAGQGQRAARSRRLCAMHARPRRDPFIPMAVVGIRAATRSA